MESQDLGLLSDPFLQAPESHAVQVVWFTEFAGDLHEVVLPETSHRIKAVSRPLPQLFEDGSSHVGGQAGDGSEFTGVTERAVWRHEARVSGLEPGAGVPYFVSSRDGNRTAESDTFHLRSLPLPGQGLTILLTSDHQLGPMVAANLQHAAALTGGVDAVFLAGDCVNVPDRASEWFDDSRGLAFFPCLQGRGTSLWKGDPRLSPHTGGALIQNAPLLTAVGNHEVMGRPLAGSDLDARMVATHPRHAAEAKAARHHFNSETDREAWIDDHSFNTRAYDRIFSLPGSDSGGSRTYSLRFGDVHLTTLFLARAWRPPARGRYFDPEEEPGYGAFPFESCAPGSRQYQWLEGVLQSRDFQESRWRVVMLHHTVHGLGVNAAPPFAVPTRDASKPAHYRYPPEHDTFHRDVEPLLEKAGVHLVLFGHSHLWNRLRSPGGVHYLETSNVGNSHGAYYDTPRPGLSTAPPDPERPYQAVGDPAGWSPIAPNHPEALEALGLPIRPYVSSNRVTVFSVLDTATGTVSSYGVRLANGDGEAHRFDAFSLRRDHARR